MNNKSITVGLDFIESASGHSASSFLSHGLVFLRVVIRWSALSLPCPAPSSWLWAHSSLMSSAAPASSLPAGDVVVAFVDFCWAVVCLVHLGVLRRIPPLRSLLVAAHSFDRRRGVPAHGDHGFEGFFFWSFGLS